MIIDSNNTMSLECNLCGKRSKVWFYYLYSRIQSFLYAGWRIDDHGRILCPECARKAAGK